jgi:RimJ/RimL family protein N-acetyltransferase
MGSYFVPTQCGPEASLAPFYLHRATPLNLHLPPSHVVGILALVGIEKVGVSLEDPIRTGRLVLRPLGEGDIPALLSYRSLPDVCRWVPFEPMDAETLRVRVEGQWSQLTLAKEGDVVILGVEVAATGDLVGDAMLRWSSEEHRSGEVGYVIHPASAGRGYATEAAHALLHVAFDGLRLHRVIARVDARNEASAHVASRLGMREEAHLVENEWFKGGWSDELDFAILEGEWRAGHLSGCPRFGEPSS